MGNFECILVIPDLHVPFHHPDALNFLIAVRDLFKPNHVVCLGDEIDGHCISFHDNDPDLPFSPSSELEKAIWHLEGFYKEFPQMRLVESNHGSLVYRKGKHAGLPRHVFKSYKEILQAPEGWIWSFDYTCKSVDKIIYFHHSQGKSVLRNSKNQSMCYVQGHWHGQFDVQYWANSENLYWGVTSGCLIDKNSLAFAYGKNNLPKPILGCTIIEDGYPYLIPMKLNSDGRWMGKL